MGEPYEPVLNALDLLAKDGMANPFGCAGTLSPVWYIRGISQHWDQYGGNSFGMQPNGRPYLEYTDVYNAAKELAEKYPGQGIDNGKASVKNLVDLRDHLELPVVLARQSEESCLVCGWQRQQEFTRPTTAPEFVDETVEDILVNDDYDDFDEEEN